MTLLLLIATVDLRALCSAKTDMNYAVSYRANY